MKASEALKIADDYNRLPDIDKEIIKIYDLIEESAKAGNYWPTYSLNKPNLYESILDQLLIDGYVVLDDDYIREQIKKTDVQFQYGYHFILKTSNNSRKITKIKSVKLTHHHPHNDND